MSKYTLTYTKNKSQEICIENVKEESGYFKEEYETACKLIEEIIKLQGNNSEKEKKENIRRYGCNNRILFTGQRGCGKTSVMRSLANYLSSDDSIKFYIKFCCLPMVDPSHFDNNNNILLTVITNMFSEAKKKMKDSKDKDGGDTSDREELLKQFENVFKSLSSINLELSSYTLETLNKKSDAEDLREKIRLLVCKYLKFYGLGDDSRLILLIDDLDMSVSYAPDMLEQLRKYLEIDNLIILMSANLGQLTNEMREKYSSAFKNTLKDSNQALSIDVEDLATKYLLKLFPTSRRINVERHISQLLETDLEGVITNPTCQMNFEGCDDSLSIGATINFKGQCFCGRWESSNNITSNDVKPQGNFQKVILSLIWSKTRLLFIPKDPENTLHPIIPTNLRDLAQFLDMLMDLDDVKPEENNLFYDKDSYNNCKENLQKFKNYVMSTWIPNHLSVEEEMVFKNIPADITEINKHLINSINVIGNRHKNQLMSRQVDLGMIERNAENVNIDRDIYTMVSPNDPKFIKANKISDIFNQPSNYSYGDLLLIIDKYETYFESEEHRRLTDAIKIYYSILLFETMFFKSNNVKYEFAENQEYPIIPIQRLIGGNVYYPNYFEIITDKNFNQKGPSFDAKRAFYHKVKVNDGDKVGNGYPLFAVLYYGDIRPDRYEKDHIYDTTFKKNAEVDGNKYVTFDILSILNNMLNPCHTLSRLDNTNHQPNDLDPIFNNISAWGDFNKIDDKFVPNAILPFYSVDMMLSYLSKSYQTSEVATEHKKDYETEKNLIADGKNMFSLREDDADMAFLGFYVPLYKSKCLTILNKLNLSNKNKYITALDNDDYQGAKISNSNENDQCKEYNEMIENLIKYNKYVNSSNSIFEKCKNDVEKIKIDESSIVLLSDNLLILKESYNSYKKLTTSTDNKGCPDDTQAIYRDYVIALIMSNYKGSKKDRDNLIKGLHKFTTVSEIYKHLVEVLWDNAIMEMLIRADIQNKIREPKSVGKYYELLWKETEKMLSDISVETGIYKSLCIEAGQKFITNSFLQTNENTTKS